MKKQPKSQVITLRQDAQAHADLSRWSQQLGYLTESPANTSEFVRLAIVSFGKHVETQYKEAVSGSK